MVDGVAVPDSGIEGVFEPDSSGEDSDPLSDMMPSKSDDVSLGYSQIFQLG